MVEAARRRLGDRAAVEVGDLNQYAPAGPVAATTVFRAIYYAEDRAAFFARVAGFTERKLVFDLNPRQYRVGGRRRELRAAGLRRVELRPFFVPQTRRLPALATGALKGARAHGPARAARAPRALHVPRRRGSLGTDVEGDAGAERAALAAARLRVDLRRHEGLDLDLGAPRPVGRREHDGPARAGRHVRPSREAVSRAIAGCLSAPRPSSPMRTRATPGRRTPAGQNVSRDSVTTASPVPPCGHVELVVRRARGLAGSPGSPTIQPSAAIPVSFERSRIGAVEANERGVRLRVRGDHVADDLDAVRREHEVRVRVRRSVPSTSCRSGVSV